MKKRIRVSIIVSITVILAAAMISSKNIEFTPIDLVEFSGYDRDRIIYQRIEKFISREKDHSVESLLIIKDRRVILIKDGYDNPEEVRAKRLIYDIERTYKDVEALWPNKINANPDYIKILDRRIEKISSFNEDFVTKNFGFFYKSIRDKFIKHHVAIFRSLMKNRGEYGFYAKRNRIARTVKAGAGGSPEIKEIYSYIAGAKASDETLYFCEDADGDGITETFSVHFPDGFNWGVYSGPNVIFVYGNKDKEIESMIGKLANEAYNGSVDEEKNAITSFPKEPEVDALIKSIFPVLED